MHPTLLSFGSISISSFGFFLILAFFSAVFVIWRVARVYEADEEKLLDFIILTFFASLIGARVYFVLTHLKLFHSLLQMILITKYPGLSLWGGFIFGVLVLYVLIRKSKLSFWQMTDFGAVGLTFALAIGNLGCLLSGCNYGFVSKSPFAVQILGVLGRRFPLSLVESGMFLIIFWYLWRSAIKFHFTGKISALFLALFGLLKFILEFFRADSSHFFSFEVLTEGQIFGIVCFTLGIFVFYNCSKRNLLSDLKSAVTVFFSGKRREKLLVQFRKICYNQFINLKLRLRAIPLSLFVFLRKLRKKFNVQTTPADFK